MIDKWLILLKIVDLSLKLEINHQFIKGNDSVCMCRTKNALPSVETYFNDYKQNTDVLNESDRSLGLFNISAKIIGSYLMCRFSRIKKIENLDKFYDISNPYYLLVASGKTNSLGKLKIKAQVVQSNFLL